MSILDNLLSRFGYNKAGAPKSPPVALQMARDAQYSLPDGSTYQAQATLYQKLTWISTAIDVIANSAAGVDFSVKRRIGEDEKDIPNHPFELLLESPNPLQSRFEFWRDYYSYRVANGNSFVFKNAINENTPPSELWV